MIEIFWLSRALNISFVKPISKPIVKHVDDNMNNILWIGYSSIAQSLYTKDNFEKDFFTGLSTGLNFSYKDLVLNFGLKNLGSAGLIQSISLIKKLN